MKKEIDKKVLLLLIVLASTILLNLFLVAAQDETAQTNLDRAADWIAEKYDQSSFGITAERATPWFLGLLLFIVLYSVLTKTGIFSRTPGEIGVGAGIVSLIITILAFLYTPADFWNAIAIQYSVLGAGILTLIPFMVFFYFTTAVSESLLMSYVFWIVYIIYYFIAFTYKILTSTKSITDPENLLYLMAIIGGIVMLIILGAIRKWFWTEELLSKREAGVRKVQKAKTGADILGTAADTFSQK